MQTEIIARVAELIRNPDAKKLASEAPVSKKSSIPDTVELSAVGLDKQKSLQHDLEEVQSNWEKERIEKIAHLKDQVEVASYGLHPQMVDEIADRIIKLL